MTPTTLVDCNRSIVRSAWRIFCLEYSLGVFSFRCSDFDLDREPAAKVGLRIHRHSQVWVSALVHCHEKRLLGMNSARPMCETSHPMSIAGQAFGKEQSKFKKSDLFFVFFGNQIE